MDYWCEGEKIVLVDICLSTQLRRLLLLHISGRYGNRIVQSDAWLEMHVA